MKLEDVYYHIRQPKNYEDFWELNQEFSYVEPFSSFKKEKDSAKIMMAIYMVYDPKSQLVNSGESEVKIKEDIKNNFIKNPEFEWKDYRELVVAYKSYSKSKIEKELEQYYLDIIERREYAKDLDIEDDYERKNDIIKTHKSYLKDYFDCADRLKEDRQERLFHGNYTPSLLELWILESK